MPATQQLHDLGQSLWIDNITRDMLKEGTLQQYIEELSLTGLTSNPTIFQKAIKSSKLYDDSILELRNQGREGEQLFFELALQDIQEAADLFLPVWERTAGVDGWVSLEVSPTLAYDTAGTIASAIDLHERAGRSNVLIKIPGTTEGLPAIEESIFAGIPVNVTLLFSPEHYVAAAEAYLRGIERRIEAGLNPVVGSVASLFISRWDRAVVDQVPENLHNRLGIAIGQQCYKAYKELMNSPRWQRIFNCGAQMQRLLWASTGAKDPNASDVLYITSLASPFTVNTMPEETLHAFADHGETGELLADDGGESGSLLGEFTSAGVDCDALAAKLQKDGAESFVDSWKDLLEQLASKSASLTS
ncbi:MAG: transaldolase [bacterium]|nr:transaldolase [bacterium]